MSPFDKFCIYWSSYCEFHWLHFYTVFHSVMLHLGTSKQCSPFMSTLFHHGRISLDLTDLMVQNEKFLNYISFIPTLSRSLKPLLSILLRYLRRMLPYYIKLMASRSTPPASVPSPHFSELVLRNCSSLSLTYNCAQYLAS